MSTESAKKEWVGPKSKKEILGHPAGLYVLFTTEMWERFCYYGMRGLLKLYIVNYLFITLRQTHQGREYDGHGNPDAVIGWNFFKGLMPSLTPDELAKCVTERVPALIAGEPANGVAGVTSELAHQIAQQTCQMQPVGSTLYGWYTGLVYLTPLLGGYVADRYWGQKRSVYVGGVLMALGQFLLFASENYFFFGLLLLILGNGFFKPNVSTQVGNLYKPGDKRRDGAFTIFYIGINLGAFLTNFVCGPLAQSIGWRYGFLAAGIGMVLSLVIQMIFGPSTLAPDTLNKKVADGTAAAPIQKEENESQRIWALILLCALNIVFWAVYEQQGNTMQTWADERTHWPTLFGWRMPSTLFQSVNPFFIFTLAPLIDRFWAWEARRGKEMSSVTKMAVGCIILGLSFIVMVIGAKVIGPGKGSLFWPIFCTMLLTIGELYLSPVGLSLVTKVSPVRFVSMMMGMWFMSSFLGNIMSGYIGVLYSKWSADTFFMFLMALGVSAGLAIAAFNKPLRKAMGNHSS